MKSLLIICLLCSSCAIEMLSKSPPRAVTERFYRLNVDKPGVIYHRKCKNRVGERRDCVETEYDLVKTWKIFAPEFILLPYKYKF